MIKDLLLGTSQNANISTFTRMSYIIDAHVPLTEIMITDVLVDLIHIVALKI